MKANRTFDNRGLGDDALPADLQDIVDQAAVDTGQATAPVGSPSNPLALPTMNVSVPATQVSFSLASLLQPPYVYLLVGGAIFAAWHFSKKN